MRMRSRVAKGQVYCTSRNAKNNSLLGQQPFMFSVLSGADILIERKLKSDEKLNVQTQTGGMLKMKINHKRKYFKWNKIFLSNLP